MCLWHSGFISWYLCYNINEQIFVLGGSSLHNRFSSAQDGGSVHRIIKLINVVTLTNAGSVIQSSMANDLITYFKNTLKMSHIVFQNSQRAPNPTLGTTSLECFCIVFPLTGLGTNFPCFV